MGTERALERQAAIIAAIRSHLTTEENERVSDAVLWQRAVKFGPKTSQGHAEALRNALAAADQYGAELTAEFEAPLAEGKDQ